MLEAPVPSPEVVDRLVGELSNWGRFGTDDERGTLNLIGDDERRAAAGLVRSGRTVSLARRMKPQTEPDNSDPLLHLMKKSGERADEVDFCTSSDWIGLGFHGFGTTHLDALCHVMWKGRMYNDIDARQVTTDRGARRLSVEAMAGGIVGRGVLLDVPVTLGLRWLEPGYGLCSGDLDACEEAAGVKVGRGDIVLVRTGRDARRQEKGAQDPLRAGLAGLMPECAAWFHERDVAVLGSDGVSDVMVPGQREHLMPIHVVALVAMGLPLMDNLLLEELATACSEERRWEFLLCASPLMIQGGTGSPLAPTAVF